MNYNDGDRFNVVITKIGTGERDVISYVPADRASIIYWVGTTKQSIDNIEYSDIVKDE